jgi:DNA-binding NtrC family response regulator
MASVLVVDDEQGQRFIVASILKSAGHTVFEAPDVDQAWNKILENKPEVVLTDLKMPGKSGLTLVEEIAKLDMPPEVVVITAFGSIDTAVKAMRYGAYDYLNKPLEREELLLIIQRAHEKFSLRVEGRELRSELARQITDGIIKNSQEMKDIIAIAERVAHSDSTVLIRGESGTGKERIAKLFHYHSSRAQKPIQSINCAAFPETLLESELFGYEKGAFTGAQNRRIGIIEAASGSTLFLDEIGDMPLSTQAKLLRVIQEREIRRLGSTKTTPVDIRIIAATHRNLEEAMRQGLFRDDLFYRINIIPIVIPPLREREQDIRALITYFINKSGKPKTIEHDALRMLLDYSWPGNVRELEAVMERISVLSTHPVITIADLPHEIKHGTSNGNPANTLSSSVDIPHGGIVFEDLEKHLLIQALEKSDGVMAEAAKLLGMSYRTFQYRADKFGIRHN